MSEMEAANYKRDLIRSHQGEISMPGDASLLMMHPARTQAEIDGVFEKLKAQHAKEQAAERARFQAGRRPSGKKPSTPLPEPSQ